MHCNDNPIYMLMVRNLKRRKAINSKEAGGGWICNRGIDSFAIYYILLSSIKVMNTGKVLYKVCSNKDWGVFFEALNTCSNHMFCVHNCS